MIQRHSGESSAIWPVGVVTQTTWAPACTSERYRSSLRRTASAELRRSVTSTAISATPAMLPSGSCEGNQEKAQCRSSWAVPSPGPSPAPADGRAVHVAGGAAAPRLTGRLDSNSGWPSASTCRTADSARAASGPGQTCDGSSPT